MEYKNDFLSFYSERKPPFNIGVISQLIKRHTHAHTPSLLPTTNNNNPQYVFIYLSL